MISVFRNKDKIILLMMTAKMKKTFIMLTILTKLSWHLPFDTGSSEAN